MSHFELTYGEESPIPSSESSIRPFIVEGFNYNDITINNLEPLKNRIFTKINAGEDAKDDIILFNRINFEEAKRLIQQIREKYLNKDGDLNKDLHSFIMKDILYQIISKILVIRNNTKSGWNNRCHPYTYVCLKKIIESSFEELLKIYEDQVDEGYL